MKAVYEIVRNNIILKSNKNIIYRKLSDSDFKYYLKLKIKTETLNMINKNNILLDELTEINELFTKLCIVEKISKKDIENNSIKMNKNLGNYDNKIFLIAKD